MEVKLLEEPKVIILTRVMFTYQPRRKKCSRRGFFSFHGKIGGNTGFEVTMEGGGGEAYQARKRNWFKCAASAAVSAVAANHLLGNIFSS